MPLSLNPITGQLDLTGAAGSGTGDVVGPASSTDNAVARYDGVTGKLLQDSLVTIDDSGTVLVPDGTALLPSYGFGSEPGTDTGMYRTGVGSIGWSSQGNLAMELTPGGDLEIQGNFTADNFPPTGSANTIASFDSLGALGSLPDFSVNTVSGGIDYALTLEPDNLGGQSVFTEYARWVPLQNSPNENWILRNTQTELDYGDTGFSMGVNGQALTVDNISVSHQGTGPIGNLNFTNYTASLGNGVDPLTIKGLSLISSGINVGATTTLDGYLSAIGLSLQVAAGATATSNFGAQVFYDVSNVQATANGWQSANFSPTILGIANNNGYSGVNVNPVITTFNGNASAIGLNAGGSFTTFGATGGYTGVNISPTATTMGATGYWNGVAVGGTITTSHGNVQGMTINPQINGGDANFNGINISPYGSASLPYVGGLTVNLASLASTAQKYALTTYDGATNLNSDYSTATLPASPGFASLHGMSSTFTVASGSPMTSTMMIANNFGSSSVFGDSMGADAFGGLIGYAANAMFLQGGVAATKTVDTITGLAIAYNVIDLVPLGLTNGGTVSKSRMVHVAGFTPGGGSITVTDLYGFYINPVFGTYATNSWGFYNDSDTENYLKKSLAIDTASFKVSNSDIGLELGGDKALRFAVMSTATRNGLTALEGMTIFNTTTNLLEFYDGAQWISCCDGNLDGGVATSVYGGTVAIDGGSA